MPHSIGTTDRRSFVQRTMVSALALVGLTGASDAPEQTLTALAQHGGLRFGSAVRASSLLEPEIGALLARQCSLITPEIELKWNALSPEPGRFDFTGGDAIATFARRHGLRMRGHTLLWHGGMPGWVTAETPWQVVRGHIRVVVNRYGALVDEWDVINEPVVATGLRDSVLLRAFGPSYIERALYEAHEVAPSARLMINEYDLEYPNAEQAARRATLLALLTSLRGRGVPLHGLGVQAHLSLATGPIDAATLRDFFRAIADLGLSISITELDVKEHVYTAPVEARDAAVAEHVARFLEVALAEPAVTSLTCWGLSDRQSWLEVTDDDRARFPGSWQDGSSPGLNRGLPYDAALAAKSMSGALAAAFGARAGS